MSASYLEEPLLTFAHGNLHPDPKIGLAAFGPNSLNQPGKHPDVINVGFVGTAQTLETARKWIEMCTKGVPGTEFDLEFPGCSRNVGFYTDIVFDSHWVEEMTRSEVDGVLGHRRRQAKFVACLDLLERKIQLLAGRDRVPTCIVIALPDNLFAACRSATYMVPKRGIATRSLRCCIKARSMKFGIPTQILLEDTMDQERDTDLPSKKAWNIMTALYFKAGGVPWGPHQLPAGTCYIGVSFFRPFDNAPLMHTSVVQAFDENGESIVLRGPDFEWDETRQGRSPHLKEDAAHALIRDVLERYKSEVKRTPRRVVIHKTSYFEAAERAGFTQAVKGIASFDFVAMRPTTEIRLLRAGTRPPLRGTRFSVGAADYLYTTGYIDCLKMFPAMHVPSPLLITDHVGYDTPRDQLLWEILALTKMNWNSAKFGGLWPITLKFSKAVAEVLRELTEGPPRPQFKFYR